MVFLLASAACPYCAASSWPVWGALSNFSSSDSGGVWTTSNPNDVYPDSPEIGLSNVTASGPYVAWDGKVGENHLAIQIPALGCPESDYVSTYDPAGSIPFLVIGGVFLHLGTLVDPAPLQTGGPSGGPLTPSELNAELANHNYTAGDGSVPGAILEVQDWIEAYLWKADTLAGIAPPPSVAGNSTIAAMYDQIQ